jgi:Rrf2 family transcriptional regulator, iron-sulfur cluster assembly transcription factor
VEQAASVQQEPTIKRALEMQAQIQKMILIIEAILYIAENCETAPVGGKKLSELLQVPTRHLEPYLQNLGRGGILTSLRGARGGYKLARNKHDITISEICQIAFGNEETVVNQHLQSEIVNRIISPLIAKAHNSFWAELSSISLYELYEKLKQQKLEHLLKINILENDIIINYVI